MTVDKKTDKVSEGRLLVQESLRPTTNTWTEKPNTPTEPQSHLSLNRLTIDSKIVLHQSITF